MKNFKNISLGLLATLLLGCVFFSHRSYAAGVSYTATWIDRSNIKLAGSDGSSGTLTDSKWDANWDFTGSLDNGCKAEINGFPGNDSFHLGFTGSDKKAWNATDSVANIEVQRYVGTSCTSDASPGFKETDKKFPIGSYQNAAIAYTWVDAGTIQRVDSPGNWTFTNPQPQSNGITRFTRSSEANDSSCRDVLDVSTDKGTMKLYENTTNSDSGVKSPADSNCWLVSTISIYDEGTNDPDAEQAAVPSDYPLPLENVDQAQTPAGTGQPVGNGNTSQCTTSTPCDTGGDSCASNAGTFAFTWIVCPIMDVVERGTNLLLNLFEGQLNFTVSDLNSSGHGGQGKVETTWSVIRDIASTLTIIVMLLLVLSQASSWGTLDAYTVRKMLPKLVVAVILIQISWDLFAWVVDFVDAIGRGLADILYYPFGGSANMDLGSLLYNAKIGSKPASSIAWSGGILATFAAAGILGIAAAPAVLSSIVTALFALMVGLITLMFRKILIIAALIFSPIALLAWVIPGTQKYWKLWWDNFTKALMMFPIVVSIIAVGRIFAYVVGTQDTGAISIVLNFIFIMVGYFAPLFILPKTYKWGGQFMNSAGSTIASTTKPLSNLSSTGAKNWAQRKQDEYNNKLNYAEDGKHAAFRRGLYRIGGGHIVPNVPGLRGAAARSRKLALQAGEKWANEENDIAAAFSRNVYNSALTNGYETYKLNEDGKYLDEHGNVTDDVSKAVKERIEPGVAAAKQALVDLAHHEDRRVARGAITQLIETSSWPEIQGARATRGPKVGRRVYEENSNWTQTLAKVPSLYKSVLDSRTDLASHVVESGEKFIAKTEPEIRSTLSEMGVTDHEEQTELMRDKVTLKNFYQMHYAIAKQMSSGNFAGESDGFYQELDKLANEAPGGHALKEALARRFEEMRASGHEGEVIIGRLVSNTAAPSINKVLSGRTEERYTEEGEEKTRIVPRDPHALNGYIPSHGPSTPRSTPPPPTPAP